MGYANRAERLCYVWMKDVAADRESGVRSPHAESTR